VTNPTHPEASNVQEFPWPEGAAPVFGQAVSPDSDLPPWKRRYFCPQCPPPGIGQPRDGFTTTEFANHTWSHATAYMRDLEARAERSAEAIEELQRAVELPMLPDVVLAFVELCALRAFHVHDEPRWEAWKARLAKARTACPSCKGSGCASPPPNGKETAG